MAASKTKLWKGDEREISPGRTVVWSEPHKLRKVPVLYYLSKNGQLQHPHFMEVPLSSPHALFLTDVINRLNALRGKGMASNYSWSCKRSYKNGYVWHDLSDKDFIYPAHGNEYILKGSELPENAFLDAASPSPKPPESHHTGGDDKHRRRRSHSCSSIDLDKLDEDDSHRLRPRATSEIEIEISTPPSDSSPETLRRLMKADGSAASGDQIQKWSRSSSMLMQLISCGTMSFKICGAGAEIGARGGGGGKGKEYFSGSIVETTKKEEFPAMIRSTSYDGDRRAYLGVAEKEIEGLKLKCIPTKAKLLY